MNWDAIGAMSEAVGAAGVMLTLAYLANQIRLSRVGVEATSVDALSVGWNMLNAQCFSDEAAAGIMMRGFADPEALSEVERFRFMLMVQSYINHFMTIKRRHDAGLLPAAEWEVHSRGFTAYLDNPGGRWVAERVAITPEVLALMREHRDRGDGPDYGLRGAGSSNA